MSSFRKESEKAVRKAVKLGAHSIWLTVDTVAVCLAALRMGRPTDTVAAGKEGAGT